MKTILKIIAILLVAAVVAGGFFLAVNNTSTSSDSVEGGQPPAMTSASGQPMERPEGGGEDSASITRGLSGVIATLAKLTVITIIVWLAQKGFSLLGKRKFSTAHARNGAAMTLKFKRNLPLIIMLTGILSLLALTMGNQKIVSYTVTMETLQATQVAATQTIDVNSQASASTTALSGIYELFNIEYPTK